MQTRVEPCHLRNAASRRVDLATNMIRPLTDIVADYAMDEHIVRSVKTRERRYKHDFLSEDELVDYEGEIKWTSPCAWCEWGHRLHVAHRRIGALCRDPLFEAGPDCVTYKGATVEGLRIRAMVGPADTITVVDRFLDHTDVHLQDKAATIALLDAFSAAVAADVPSE
jgi:hypothetical protein